MSQAHPKNRSPWSTLAHGTLVRVDGVDGRIIQVRRKKKYANRYLVHVGFDRDPFWCRRPDLTLI